ncbi:hypothetical protein [Campylobacter corcagiensis]|uniref:Uncharacterized protein n=1 Tax=Campylobacter corcagiensis TaxID=1448857 RepID=A0A7M1LFB8_9BACT|nr:hypothetical protein [Campylobacter corcagiensis]QOQ87269.1 hypothetical protein IMC76_08695 [Campylobacter corcagiensis]
MQFLKNKEFANYKDENQKAYLQSVGVVFLDDEFEIRICELFFNALENKDMGVGLNFNYAKCYAKKFGLDIVEIWGVLNRLLNVVNSSLNRG